MGSTPVGGSGNSFSEYFDLRTLLRYLHFSQAAYPFVILKTVHLLENKLAYVGPVKFSSYIYVSLIKRKYCTVFFRGNFIFPFTKLLS